MFFLGGKKMKGAESIENEKLSIFAQYTLGQYLTGDKVENRGLRDFSKSNL
jgi:hypothetical protein